MTARDAAVPPAFLPWSAALAALALLLWPAWLCAAPPRVVASIGPVHSLAAAVMGDRGELLQIVRGYGSPHVYQMRPSDAASLRDADLVLWIGPTMETFLQRPLRSARPGTRVVALMELPGLELLPSRPGGAHGGHDHGHGTDDPPHHDAHIWLSPHTAKVMAAAIAAELVALDPDNAVAYRANLDRLVWRIDAMEKGIASRLRPVRNVPFLVFHDAFRYFERSFGLASVGSVTLSPDRMPSARRIRELRAEIARSGARCVFREPQFESALVQVLVEGTGAGVGTLYPLGTEIAPGPDAYIDMMNANADALLACLEEGASAIR